MESKELSTSEPLDRAKKFRRLEDLRRHVPYVSQSALAGVIDHIKIHGLPEAASRSQFSRATKALLSAEYPYGQLKCMLDLEAMDGATIQLPVLNLKSYMAALFDESASYASLLLRTKRSTFEHKWGLLMYMDEITPGNVLSGRLTRKSWCIYATMFDFTLDDLSHELAWMPLAHIRSTVVDKLKGGVSQLFAAVLKSIFLDGQCDPRLGLLLPRTCGEALKVYFDLKTILQDGGSHKFCWSYRGDAALRPCLLCNVQADTGEDAMDDEEVSLANCLKHSDLRIFTSDEILSSFDRLDAKRLELTKVEFTNWQKAVGKTWQPKILPLDPDIRSNALLAPASQYAHDWMHCCLSNGTFAVASYQLFTALDTSAWETFGEYVGHWFWPTHLSMKHLPELFQAKKIKKYKHNKRFNPGASETLSLLPILVFWCRKVLLPSNFAPLPVQAFLAVAEVIFILHEGQFWGMATRDSLQMAVERSLQLAHECGWHVMPKFHWLLHMCDQLERWQKLPSCFTPERKNKILKKYANAIQNTSAFENSVFNEIVAEELAKLKSQNVFQQAPYLVKPHKAPKKLASFFAETLGCSPEDVCTSVEAKLPTGRCSKGDIVLLESLDKSSPKAAEVWAIAQIGNTIYVLVQYLALVEMSMGTCSATWQGSSQTDLLGIELVVAPLIFCKLSQGKFRTLMPWHWFKQI